MANSNLSLYIRAPQVILALINLGLAGYVASYYNGMQRQAPGPVSFLIFATSFSLLVIPYLEIVARRFPRVGHPYGKLALEAINTILFFSGFIALAAFLGQLNFCNGPVCSAARALNVFAALEFVAWAATTGLQAKAVFQGRDNGDIMAAPPSPMIQV
ncbi:membrane-associating domain-containing protein [Stachybotrys elegans]|uniref:Membrane-associating domain-containing protein n=1 Tax=Stachybotrys elegans TaxID=80388 RepID=A0A8K0WTT4_9HYPO|nr:membrane-associating domain-containing protein [Stachybotrys elegans]